MAVIFPIHITLVALGKLPLAMNGRSANCVSPKMHPGAVQNRPRTQAEICHMLVGAGANLEAVDKFLSLNELWGAECGLQQAYNCNRQEMRRGVL